ncbi:serine hydrolase domain-containing protein [Nesterenkonia alba]|uniref:serine hydrolase domain-containing protein n=1 Tax=Nesterenkonia alba TaxID=515814 RepID=UPI0003B3898A|nr:serine hydrolase domain-containing protein [Nesterenkonia alba]
MGAWKKVTAAMVTGGVVAALIAVLLRPGAGSVDESSAVEGDTDLAAAAVAEIPAQGVYALSVAEVTPTGTRTATVGAPMEGTFEIGSVTKAVTGMLYADAVERGEVTPDTTLGEIFDFAETDSASITLEQLSQHRSGLPRLPTGLRTVLNSYRWLLLGQNPYRDEPADVVADVRSAAVGEQQPAYSNLGYAVLGHALAETTGEDYPQLVRTRLAEPMGLERFTVPAPGEGEASAEAVQGREASGRTQQAWDDAGYAPAGGIRADAQSMARLAEALLNGSAPGVAALDPTADFDAEARIGAGWITSEIQGRQITWHTGQTGGFYTWFGLDRERGTAVFISGATSHELEEAGLALLLQAGDTISEDTG